MFFKNNEMGQVQKGELFRALHERRTAFIMPNPWDAGTAVLLEHLRFEALATTSAGLAFSMGRPDNNVTREEVMRHLAAICQATHLPVSADLESGFADDPEGAAETYLEAAATGVVGGSIEDATGHPDRPLHDKAFAAERVRAVAEAVHNLPFQFTLTARAENFLVEHRNLSETISRLQAYQEAGADVLYAPGLTTAEEIAAVVSSVDRPVSVLMGLSGVDLNLAVLSELGVKRVSVGSSLCRAALSVIFSAAREMQTQGTFHFAKESVGFQDLNGMFAAGPGAIAKGTVK